MSPRTPKLVGRAAELRIVEAALDTAEAGTSRSLGVLGEPGIGKSRLLDELARRAAQRGHLVVAGRAAELERDVPFALWVDALDGRIADLPADALRAIGDERLADLAVALPAIEHVCDVTPSPGVERHRVARAVRGLLEALAARGPVTVLLDDVHWADPASADVVALLLHRPPAGAALLTLAARTGRAPSIEEALQRAVHHGAARVLELGGLSRDDADALFAPGLGPAARARVYRESGGNPFFLEALAGGVKTTRAAGISPATADVPRSVLAALAGEIGRLGSPARALVQGAAVAGDPFELAPAAAAGALGEGQALEAIDELLACDLVRPTDDPRRWRFRHPLVRRAVYESAGGGWRLGAHGRAAALLAGRGATPAECAHHVARAAQPGDLAAVELLERAAGDTATTAPATAAEWNEAALAVLPLGAEHATRRFALLRALARSLAAAGRPVEAHDALRQALGELAPDAVERVEVVTALAELAAVWTQQPGEAGRMLAAERTRLAERAPGAAAVLTLAMAAERAAAGDHAATERLADEARDGARSSGDVVLEAAAAAGAADAAHCRLRTDDPDALAAVDAKIDEAGRLVDALCDEQVAERLHMLLSLTLARLFSGHPVPALQAVQRGLAVARRSGQGLLAPAFVCMRGFVAHELGRLDSAEADGEEALEAALISGNVAVAYWASIGSSWTALARGRPDAALAYGQSAWDLLGAHAGSQAGFSVADARLAAGDPQGAHAALEAFGWVSPQLWTLDRLKAADVAVRVMLALGRPRCPGVGAPRPGRERWAAQRRVRRDHRPRRGERPARLRRAAGGGSGGACRGRGGRRSRCSAVGRALPDAERGGSRRRRRGRQRTPRGPPRGRRARRLRRVGLPRRGAARAAAPRRAPSPGERSRGHAHRPVGAVLPRRRHAAGGADRPRARGRRTARGRRDERPDRPPPASQREHGREARVARAGQARDELALGRGGAARSAQRRRRLNADVPIWGVRWRTSAIPPGAPVGDRPGMTSTKPGGTPMHRTPRRPKASMAVALVALFCALGGTAIAQSGILITSPDQLGPSVVTSPKIATGAVRSTTVLDRSIAQRDMVNPTLRAEVRKDGTAVGGDVGGGVQHVAGSNRYDIGFTSSDLGPSGLDTCAFVVSPRFDFDQSSGHRALRAYVNHATGSPTIQVFTYQQRSDGLELASEADFDVVAAC